MTAHQTQMRRIYDEVFSQGKVELIPELMHEDFVEHEELPPGIPNDRNAPRMMTEMMRSAFPDFEVTVEDMLEDGDKVVARARFSGTHEGEFMGMAPTGNRFDISLIDIIEFEGDRAIAHWGVMDTAKMMEQLGAGA